MSHKRIIIGIIPHNQQRYDTVGDYWRDPDGTLQFRISAMEDPRYEIMVAIHELVEQLLCEDAGITNEVIDGFDIFYTGEGEPGDDPAAPYQRQHLFANGIEKMLCAALNIKWSDYDAAVGSLE